MALTYREYVPADQEATRVLLNGIFTSALQSEASWAGWVARDFTAPVALLDDQVVGAIPLKRRLYRVAPGAAVTAWVEHRVGVAEAHRAKGLGSGMQACAKQFLAGRGDVLMVYRGGERSDGYRFYEKNGLLDVSYVRYLTLDPAKHAGTVPPPSGVRWVTEAQFLAKAPDWCAIFGDCYGHCGGYPVRTPPGLRDQIEAGIWKRAIVNDLVYAVLQNDGTPDGYLIGGIRDNVLQVLELAVRGADLAAATGLLAAALARGLPVLCRATPGSLQEAACRRLGAPLPAREKGAFMIMVHVLDIAATGAQVWVDGPGLHDVEVRVWTPLREGVVHAASPARRVLTLEMKEQTLSQLLMRRLDVKAAVAEERITLQGDQPGDVEALAAAFRPAPWVYHQIDYL